MNVCTKNTHFFPVEEDEGNYTPPEEDGGKNFPLIFFRRNVTPLMFVKGNVTPLILLRRKNFPLIFLHWFMMVRFEIPEKKVQVLKIWNFDTFKTMKLFIALCKNFEIRLIPTQAIWGRGKHKQERKTLPLIVLRRKSFPLILSKGNYVPPIFLPCSSHIQGRNDLTSPNAGTGSAGSIPGRRDRCQGLRGTRHSPFFSRAD